MLHVYGCPAALPPGLRELIIVACAEIGARQAPRTQVCRGPLSRRRVGVSPYGTTTHRQRIGIDLHIAVAAVREELRVAVRTGEELPDFGGLDVAGVHNQHIYRR
jgi:hypothetical protein